MAAAIRSIHVNTEPGWGGGERQTLLLARGLADRGHPAAVVCPPGGGLAARAREAGLPVCELRMRGEADPIAAFRLARFARGFGAGLLHAHTGHALGLAWLATVFAGRMRRVATRRIAYSIYRHSFLGLNGLKYRRGADRVIAISEAVRDQLLADGIEGERLPVVHSGVEVGPLREALSRADPESLRRELGIPPGAPVLGTIASLVSLKAHDVLLAAFARVARELPEARLVVVGEGPLRRDLEAQAARLGLAEKVRFPGHRSDVAAFLALFELFVLCSRHEGLGTSLLDAMIARRPVVACRAGGMPEIVAHGETGLLVEPEDPDALAAACLQLLRDPQRAARLAAAGEARAASLFGADRMVDGTLAVYRELMEEGA